MLLKLNYRFINFLNHYKTTYDITEASTVQCTQGCNIIQKVWGPDICCLSNLQRPLLHWTRCFKKYLNKS